MGGGTTREKVTDDSLRSFMGYNMKRAFNVVQADLNATLSPFGLRMITFSTLAIIVENPGCRSSEIAQTLSIERANLVDILSALEADGLIFRSLSKTDRRAHSITVTAAGEELFGKANMAVRAHDERMLNGITHRGELRACLRMIEEVGS